MRYIYLLLLLFAGCSEDVNLCKNCIQMTISDSLPFQFWVNGKETYNEKQICGVYDACFCAPWLCNKEVVLQFGESDDNSNYDLVILDDSLAEITTVPLEIGNGFFGTSFTPSLLSPELCDKQVSFRVVKEFLYNDLTNPTFNDGTWINIGSGQDWAFDFYAGVDNVTSSKRLRHPFYGYSGNTFTFTISGQSQLSSTSSLKLYFGTQLIDFGSIPMGSFSFTQDITLTSNIEYIEFHVLGSGSSNLLIEGVNISGIIVKSDCIDIRAAHDNCLVEITYTNTKNFDGIDYENQSPPPVFTKLIHGQFWKEDNPQEQEDSVLSNGVIVTRRSEIQEKTLLEIGFVPNYEHKKIQKILMHNSVQIEDVNGDLTYWKKRDAYESENLNRYPLKKGQVWLTKYNSVEKNTI